MQIAFRTNRLCKLCNSMKLAQGSLGKPRARKLFQRLAELQAAPTLADVGKLPAARCHELKGNRRGQLAVDLAHPYRLILEPANNPVPLKADGGLDWQQVTAIEIIEVEDYHGR